MRTPIIGLQKMAPFQSNAALAFNRMLRDLEAAINIEVLDRNLTTPPAVPSETGRYIVPLAATGDWLGKEGSIAYIREGRWRFVTPRLGWLAYVQDEGERYRYDGAAWILVTFGSTYQAVNIGYNNTQSGLTATNTQTAIDELGAVLADILSAFYPCSPTLDEEILADSPTAYWRCDETAGTTLADASGNGHTMTLQGTYVLAQSEMVPTLPDKRYLYLSGVAGSGAERTGTLGLTTPLASSYTVECIVTVHDTSLSVARFFDIGGDVGSEVSAHNSQITLYHAVGALTTGWEHGAGINDNAAADVTPLREGKAYHLVLTRDTTNGLVQFFINGVFAGDGTDTDDPTGGENSNSRIGFALNQAPHHGLIGHVALYYGTVLSPARIAAHASAAGLNT